MFNIQNLFDLKETRQLTSSPTQTDFKKSPKLKKTTNIKVVDSKPAVYTHYDPFLKKDKDILKDLFKVLVIFQIKIKQNLNKC